MPPDLPNEQALILKKRARRRLVGAIALVLLMIIVLPRILQDRATQTTQESIKITMPEQPGTSWETQTSAVAQTENTSAVTELSSEAEIENLAAQQAEPEIQAPVVQTQEAKSVPEKTVVIKPAPATANKSAVKPESNLAKIEPEAGEPAKGGNSFTVQVGVFSDAANVKQLQQKLKQAGFDSYTEQISTTNGQKIRLRAGKFSSRQQASDALNTIKSAGLSGMVISN